MKNFKLIVAGGRDFEDYDRLSLVLFSLGNHALAEENISLVTGVDAGTEELASIFAEDLGITIDFYKDAPTSTQTKIQRNQTMAKQADGAVVFDDGKSEDLQFLIAELTAQNKFVHVVHY